MMKPTHDHTSSLHVWYESTLVGLLWCDPTGKLGFEYHSQWLSQGFAISQQLPLTASIYPSTQPQATQFFSNLLPEAGARMHIIKALKITNSDFELLKAIGGECAGALSILPIDEQPELKGTYKRLNDEEEFEDIHGRFSALQRVQQVIKKQCYRALQQKKS